MHVKIYSTKYIPAALSPSPLRLPHYGHKVPAGFPPPADDYVEKRLDLNEHLIAHKEATFFIRLKGDSLRDRGVFDGDMAVVDRSLVPAHGNIVIASVDGEITAKVFYSRGGQVKLCAANTAYPDIVLSSDGCLEIWGVVKHVIRSFS